MSCVMYHISHVTFHMAHFMCFFFSLFYPIEVQIWEINFFKVMFTDNFANFPTNLSRYYQNNLFSTLNSRRFENMCKLPHKLPTQKRASVRLLHGQMKLDISDKPLTQKTIQCMCKKSTNFVTITLNLENRNHIFLFITTRPGVAGLFHKQLCH